ncbi:B12-binding domain-containing radical SAM protein [Pleionea mediterranea]|uniref:Radical SAM superfamily enzyme YgiQ (UPF0313 family) n=1 Tax=Pleionea mediterranea TaxID=523701 RepID=A0A316FMB6_9GAMM|nr:B12-binding domain-containing radical SAM protein [Pleionea mediterranea]PWK50031.1 radical SAM superfamily enzyme YgiQ (UPF0313 family) [Pleionea mediterranea]
MKKILLATLNAKYIHANLGLRYLYANLEDLQPHTQLKEFTIKTRAIDIVENILETKPAIVGFGVYIWNIEETFAVVAQLKTVAPEIKIILGGPEVSYESQAHPIANHVDYIVIGAADKSFYQLCKDILNSRAPVNQIINSKPLKLNELKYPYEYYTNEDLANRLIYVEASRGCPFKCEFCLSALDKTSYPFDLDEFLQQMDNLYQRGARHFKFVDRTFNLKINTTLQILDFFLERLDDKLFLHFEVIPDHLPEKLKDKLKAFPLGSLQFEIGIQTFNQQVQTLISRKQNNDKSKANLVWLRENTNAHIHADLIFGLPGEKLETFANSFDELYACHPHEIQLGILKRLKGSPIIRHTDDYNLKFNPLPPYNILSNSSVDFITMQRVNRFARYWDMLANSGRFKLSLPLLIEDNPFDRFMMLTEWLFQQTQQTHQINLKRLFELLLNVSDLFPEIDSLKFIELLQQDYEKTKLKGRLQISTVANKLDSSNSDQASNKSHANRATRQMRHIG